MLTITKANKQYCERILTKVGYRLGLTILPKLIYRKVEYTYYAGLSSRAKTYKNRHNPDRLKGIAFYRPMRIYINIRMHKDKDELKDTIIHELIHFKFKKMNHCKRFFKFIEYAKSGHYKRIRDYYNKEILQT